MPLYHRDFGRRSALRKHKAWIGTLLSRYLRYGCCYLSQLIFQCPLKVIMAVFLRTNSWRRIYYVRNSLLLGFSFYFALCTRI
ncbi:hypothetical protein EV127DRAFT_517718 [Xylaria flabelliformis]|nr:hypothetical protein EV127DRAFT_517718 [Xylaria flabelliformis]